MTDTTITTTSVLKTLRSLRPNRILSYEEELQRAELQASRLLALSGICLPAVPTEIVADLPRIRVERSFDLPASGSAHWADGTWIITLNAAEHPLRQRFSLMHEFKHVIDHPTRHLIDRQSSMDASAVGERLADHFAACALMPRAWVKAAFCNQTQRVEELANLFHVSFRAMSVRLASLGLTVPVDRCTAARRPVRRSSRRYFRRPSETVGVHS